jgi:replicative superfamily II helicase
MSASEGRLFEVDVIVLDEVHYLSDISRGTVWEETVCYYLTLLSSLHGFIGHLTCLFLPHP